jgi:hypothetical protein
MEFVDYPNARPEPAIGEFADFIVSITDKVESNDWAARWRGPLLPQCLDRLAHFCDGMILFREGISPDLLELRRRKCKQALFGPNDWHCFLPVLLPLLLTQSVEDMTAMAEIISLSKVRKRKARDAKEEQAAENRIKFGRTKAEREKIEAGKALEAKKLDAHKRDDESEP